MLLEEAMELVEHVSLKILQSQDPQVHLQLSGLAALLAAVKIWVLLQHVLLKEQLTALQAVHLL